jgi:hypothetical protein
MFMKRQVLVLKLHSSLGSGKSGFIWVLTSPFSSDCHHYDCICKTGKDLFVMPVFFFSRICFLENGFSPCF